MNLKRIHWQNLLETTFGLKPGLCLLHYSEGDCKDRMKWLHYIFSIIYLLIIKLSGIGSTIDVEPLKCGVEWPCRVARTQAEARGMLS